MIEDGAVDSQKLDNNAVTGTKIADGTVSYLDIQDGSTLDEIKDDDGAGSGLDADTLDGLDSSAFSSTSHNHDSRNFTEGESDSLFVNTTGDAMSASSSGYVLRVTNSGTGNGIEAYCSGGVGVYGKNTIGYGNYGYLGHRDYGVYGNNNTSGNYGYLGSMNSGVGGISSSTGGAGVYGYSSGAYSFAGLFAGDVRVTGTLIKGGGSFKIDHPLDPENKYLQHSFVESPDMMNIYNGNVVLDATGQAWVELPEWFEALNKDFRYQLTCIGGFAQVYIAEEVSENRFKIAGGTAGMKVSWQVTGIRQDPWAEANRIPVEEDKPEEELGYYLHPELYGQAEEKSIEWIRNPEMMQRMEEMKEVEGVSETDRLLEAES